MSPDSRATFCRRLFLALLFVGSAYCSLAQSSSGRTAVMVVGFDHLNQLYNKQPQSDVLGAKKQAELAKLRQQLRRFRPDAILVEAERPEQGRLDSLYARYQAGQLELAALPDGRRELYQIGFALAKELQLPGVRAVDYYAATSQSLLQSGANIDAFTRDLRLLQTTSRPLRALVQHDSLSVYDYIALANQPAMINLVHRAIFNTPALVTEGAFSPTATNTVDLGAVDAAYIGAHYITLHYNRNLKIYSNILRAQQQTQAKRVLVIFGVAHVGVLQELLAANPAYQVTPAATYLKTNQKQRLQAIR
ncbi:DUF5694 domain-containing protein [Hymenobacter sp. 15J16-1T3B]|uniref:DUF5694 domain-containing protein n=1 Tax=Hymenobacter sp. 15J16-1T3B TaxID=2886941 RepID=UPI001D102727|nr:DUF5694 domain-containing protein [Hymenobacter sp. 15J16-1T3B]MCC3158756.1 DUF5694 domain-containing protein [Hymenobacter sp. 15J16-1T3B]